MNKIGLDLIEAENMEQVQGANVYSIVAESHREDFINFNHFICSGNKGSLTFEIVGLKGKRSWMETYAAPYQLTNGEIAHLAITNDISEKVRTNEEIILKDQALMESARLSALGEFTGGIAHEINNPLAILSSRSALLGMELNNSDGEIDRKKLLNGLSEIEQTVDRIGKIITNLKSFSRKPDNENSYECSVYDTVDSTLSLCREKFKHSNIDIQVDITPTSLICCQQIQLSQVFMNLLNNSFDAVNELPDKWIKIADSKTNTHYEISFTDSGMGISESIRTKIMTPFFTTKDVGKGTGLGLSISYKFMENFGGKLLLNEQSENTQFILRFPLKSKT
jgi:C4-dicarboxylate-specific signal transduction histidine kinase